MALPIKIIKLNSSENLETFRNGGKGSGNFGHAGRPGEVGGSGDGTGDESKNEYVEKLSKYVKQKGKTIIDMASAYSVKTAIRGYLDHAEVSVNEFEDFYQVLVDYKNYSASFPISKESKEKFKKDFVSGVVDSQEQIFGEDTPYALVSTPSVRKYIEKVRTQIEDELDFA